MFIEHFVLGWLSAVPLLILLVLMKNRFPAISAGALYGVAYYVVINFLYLPLSFQVGITHLDRLRFEISQ